jgi:hypothetical protein
METPQLIEVVTQAAVNVVGLALALVHLARTARRLEEGNRDV